MTGTVDARRHIGVRDRISEQLFIRRGQGERTEVRAKEGNWFAGTSRTLAKRQESIGYREISRLTVREKL
jgi:hypothetical protein